MKNREKRATVARMHPSASTLLVIKGELVGAAGWNQDALGCSVVARIRPAESKQALPFIRRRLEYGNHLVWVYGDYTAELRELGELFKIDVELVS